jgi:hypothetical protein
MYSEGGKFLILLREMQEIFMLTSDLKKFLFKKNRTIVLSLFPTPIFSPVPLCLVLLKLAFHMETLDLLLKEPLRGRTWVFSFI